MPHRDRNRPAGAMARAAVVALAVTAAAACDRASDRPVDAIVVFTVDTLRADQLSPWGGTARTPNLDALAARSLVFERAYTQETRTHPALSSLWTGLLPTQHGVLQQSGKLHRGVRSVVEVAQDAGITTASFTSNLCSLQDLPQNVFHVGWDVRACGMLDDPEDYHDQWEWDEKSVDAFLAWLADHTGPYLAWVHLMDPHGDHRPPPHLWDYAAEPPLPRDQQNAHYNLIESERRFPEPDDLDHLMRLYRAEIAGADEQLGRVLDALARRRDADRTAIIFGADHGEELFESWSRYTHGYSMTEGVLHVPLMLHAPGVAPGRYEAPVELMQVAPTVLQLFDLGAPYPLPAPSLLHASPSRGIALSQAAHIVTSARNATYRYWRRRTPREYRLPDHQAPWRSEAPWFEQRDAIASYEDGPGAPRFRDVDHPQMRATTSKLLREMVRVEAGFREAPQGESFADPGLERELSALGYAGY